MHQSLFWRARFYAANLLCFYSRSLRVIARLNAALAIVVLGACGGGGGGHGDSSTHPAPPALLGGTINGLVSAGLVLTDERTTVNPATGATSFSFATAIEIGASYSVQILQQPTGGVYCSFDSGGLTARGTFSASTGLAIQCVSSRTTVATLAGDIEAGDVDGIGAAARFDGPRSVAVDRAGTVYVADSNNNQIRQIRAGGVVSVLAGSKTNSLSVDGTGGAAGFARPWGATVDDTGTIYVVDYQSNSLRRIAPGGIVTTLVGSLGSGKPSIPAVDSAGNVYVADLDNHVVRRIGADGSVAILAGSGEPGYLDDNGTAARFWQPSGVAIDRDGSVLVADWGNHRIRRIALDGAVTTVAGSNRQGHLDGPAAAAKFFHPSAVAVDSVGNIYVADALNHAVRMISPEGVVTTLAGNGQAGSEDGLGRIAGFLNLSGIAVDSAGVIYVVDSSNRVRTVTMY